MSITVCGYEFDGPYSSTDSLEDRSGVYAILCYANSRYSTLDVGESAEVKSRVENHDRKDCWRKHCAGTIAYAVRYTPGLQQPGRKEIEEDIRNRCYIPCGER